MSLSCILLQVSEQSTLVDSTVREFNRTCKAPEDGDRFEDLAMVFYAEYEMRAFDCLFGCSYVASIARILCECQTYFASAYLVHATAES